MVHSSGVVFLDLGTGGWKRERGQTADQISDGRRLQAGDRTDPPSQIPALAALARRGALGPFTRVTSGQDKPADGFFNALYGEPAIFELFVLPKLEFTIALGTADSKRARLRHFDFYLPPPLVVP